MSVAIRPYRLADHHAVVGLYHSAYDGGTGGSSHYPPRPPLDTQQWGARLSNGEFDPLRTYLALEDDLPIGVVVVSLLDAGERLLPALAPVRGFWGNWESALWVTPHRQRRGVGTALVRHALEALKDEGHERVLAYVFEDNQPGSGLLDAMGFQNADIVWNGEQKLAYSGGFYVHSLQDIPDVRRCEHTVCRSLRDGDVEALGRFMAHLEARERVPTLDETARRYFHSAYEHFVAERDGEIIGTMCTWSNGELVIPGVLPEARGQGVGSALMHFALHEMRARGHASATAASAEDLAGAHALYGRLGFVNTRWLRLKEWALV